MGGPAENGNGSPASSDSRSRQSRLSWKDGLFLVGPDPLTSPYYSSGALIMAGVGYATPGFQIGLYLLLFLLAPLYVEAVLLTLSNGGTYVMTRYALGHLGKLAILAAAAVGIVISFSYLATAIVSLLSYSDYVSSLVRHVDGGRTAIAIGISALPSTGFGVWVMPKQWKRVCGTVLVSSVAALILSSVLSLGAVVMLAPLIMLFTLNNEGLKESVKVSKTIFLINMAVMGVTILLGGVYLLMHGADFSVFVDGVSLPDSAKLAAQSSEHAEGHGAGMVSRLPGFATLGAPLILAGTGASILGASGVESVMNIPEELQRPRRDIGRVYKWMLTILLTIGGSLSILLFTILPPEELATKANYLLAALGHHVVLGVTGHEGAAEIWQVVIVANAALMLIGACNTGFAGARGLWVTMARDDLLPRVLLKANRRGAFQNIHWMMLIGIFLLAIEADWSLAKLERWYGATFGLVMFSGLVAFVLLRKYKSDDRRVYWAPWNLKVMGTRLPVGVLIGLLVLGYALLSMYTSYRGDIGELRRLITIVAGLVIGILVFYNHRPILRAGYRYLRRVLDTVESSAIESEERTIVVAVGSMRTGRLLQKSVSLARRQGLATGIPYGQMVVFHMTPSVRSERVYRIEKDSVRPVGIEGDSIRIFNDLTELAPPDLKVFLALVPPSGNSSPDDLQSALDALVEFHDRHRFMGHMVVIGSYGTSLADIETLQARLEGSTLVPVPLFGED